MIVCYIDCETDRFRVEPICPVLSEHGIQIAPSIYYANQANEKFAATDLHDACMAKSLLDLWRADRSVSGAEKLAGAARRAGIDIDRDQTARPGGTA